MNSSDPDVYSTGRVDFFSIALVVIAHSSFYCSNKLPIFMMETPTNTSKRAAAVTISTLSIIGYPPTNSDAMPILITSFDKSNEKLFLIALHFLLSQLDPLFASSVGTCWPYYEMKEKNEFKRIVSLALDKLTGSGSNKNHILAPGDFRPSLLSVSKGSAVWLLLKKLSDAVLDKSVRGVVMTYQTLPESNLTVKQTSALFESMESTKAEDLLAAVQREYHEIVMQGQATLVRRGQQAQYAMELDARLDAATKTIQHAKASMQRISQGTDE